MFGMSNFGQNLYGQTDGARELIPPPWIVQCPDLTGWFQLSRRISTVEPCQGNEESVTTLPPPEVIG